MARISTYLTDDDINVNDRLVGSEQYIDSGVIKFRTKNYKVGDLATFFGISVGAVNTYLGAFNADGSFSYSSAFATKVTTTTASQGFAAATDVTTLSATVVSNKNSADASFTSVNSSIATETSARSSAITSLTATVTNNKTTTDASAVTLTQAVANETSARASAVTSLNSSISSKPNIFRQTSVPTALSAKDVWFDTDDGNRMYVSTSVGDNQVTSGKWEETTDTRLANVVTSAASATTNISTLTNSDIAKASQITELNSQFTFNGTDINGLAGSTTISSAIATAETNAVSTADTARANAQTALVATISKVFRQDDVPAVTEPVNSIWYDTNDNNKSYVLVAGTPRVWTYTVDATLATSASVTQVSNTAADINGNLSASHSLMVNAGTGAIAGMRISAETNSSGVSNSNVVFQADQFTIKTSSGTKQPFTVSGDVVTIEGTLKIGSSTASSIETKANSATQASDHATIQAGTTAANVGLANVVNSNFDSNGNVIGGAVGGTTINSTKIFQGTGTPGNANTGFYLDNGGNFSLRDKLVFNGSTGDLSIAGAISATSGSIASSVTIGGTAASTVASGAASGATANQSSNATIRAVGAATSGTIAGISISGSELYQGAGNFNNADTGFYLGSNGTFSLKDKLSWNGTTLTINGNGTFSGDISAASGSFSGSLSGNTGDIGGWKIGGTTLNSDDDLLSINSSSNSIIIKDSSGNTKVEITGSSSVTNPANVGSLSQTSNGSIPSSGAGTISSTGSSVTIGASQSTVAVLTSSGQVAPFQNKTLTVKATLNGIAFNLSSSVGTGSAVGKFGIAVYNSSGSSTPIAISDFVTVTATGSTTGNVSIPSNTIKSVTVTVGPSDTVLYVRAYFGGGSLVHPNFGTSKSVTFNRPALTNVDIAPDVNKVEVSSGGMLVAASASQFFTLDKSSNTRTNPFIRSKGFMEHQGRLTVLNASGTPGSGDIYLGGTDNDSSGYMRIFSNANSHKFIDWGDGTSNSAFQLKLRYNGNQKFQFSSTGVFDANSTKNFKINHLIESKKETHYLRHAAIEAPQADLIYRGKVTLSNGTATVNIDEVSRMSDGTFSLLCRDIQCFTSNETGWDAVKASMSNNTLTINCQNTNSSDEISWMVIAERKDSSYIDSDVTDDNGLYKTESEKED